MNKEMRGVYAAMAKGVCCLVLFVACSGSARDEKADSTEKGRQLYLRNGCAVCHGDEGRGDGRLAATLKPPPRDFKEVAAYRKGATATEIAETIGKGLAGTSMPAFAHLSAADRLEIARYIAGLQKEP
jgi:mono/diheme cytochrome c family protein